MSTSVQFRRGTTAQHAAFTGIVAEVTVNTTSNTLVVHDGITVGGHPLVSSDNPTITGNITGNLIPSANVTYSLGTSTRRWKELWISGSTIYIGDVSISAVDGAIHLPAGSTVGGTELCIAHPRSISIKNPTATENTVLFYNDQATTVSYIAHAVRGIDAGVTFSVGWSSTRDGSLNTILTATSVMSSGAKVSEGLTNTVIPADSWVLLTTSSESYSSTTEELHVSIGFATI